MCFTGSEKYWDRNRPAKLSSRPICIPAIPPIAGVPMAGVPIAVVPIAWAPMAAMPIPILPECSTCQPAML